MAILHSLSTHHHLRFRVYVLRFRFDLLWAWVCSSNSHSLDSCSRRHFRGCDWEGLLAKEIRAPYVPQVKGLDDTSMFEAYADSDDEGQGQGGGGGKGGGAGSASDREDDGGGGGGAGAAG